MAGITVARRGVTTDHGSGDLPHSVVTASRWAGTIPAAALPQSLPQLVMPPPSGDATGATDYNTLVALLAALPSQGGEVIVPGASSHYKINNTAPIVIPNNSALRLTKGVWIDIIQASGLDVFQINEGAGIFGAGVEASRIQIAGSASIGRGIYSQFASSNTTIQEEAYIDGIMFSYGGAVTASGPAVDFRQIFYPSYIKNFWCNGSNKPSTIVQVGGGTAPGGGCWITLDTVQAYNPASGACFTITDPTGSTDCEVIGYRLAPQYPANGGHGILITGNGAMRCGLRDTYFETNLAYTNPTAVIKVDGVQNFVCDRLDMEHDGSTGPLQGVWLTSNALNINPAVKHVKNAGAFFNPVLQDDLAGVTIGAVDLPEYRGVG